MNFPDNIRPNLAGDYPDIHPSALIDPSAQIIGNVKVGKNTFIGPLSVIRADERGSDGMVEPIIIGEETNIQDGVIIHSHGGTSVSIGPKTSVGHWVAIHGPCSIDEGCFLAMRSTLYSAILAHTVWIGLGALVMKTSLDAFTYVPAGSIIRSHPASRDLRLISSDEKKYMKDILEAANRLRTDYLKTRVLATTNG